MIASKPKIQGRFPEFPDPDDVDLLMLHHQ
jgi:hypothetical protein